VANRSNVFSTAVQLMAIPVADNRKEPVESCTEDQFGCGVVQAISGKKPRAVKPSLPTPPQATGTSTAWTGKQLLRAIVTLRFLTRTKVGTSAGYRLGDQVDQQAGISAAVRKASIASERHRRRQPQFLRRCRNFHQYPAA